MTSSAYGAAESWAASGAQAHPSVEQAGLRDGELEFDLLAQEPPTTAMVEDYETAPDDWGPQQDALDGPVDEVADDQVPLRARRGIPSIAVSDGLSSRATIALAGSSAAVCAGLDLALTGGRITFFFDLCFVVICLVTALSVRRTDLFTAGVLPPLLFAAVIAALSLLAPHAFESAPGVNKVFLTGLANHAPGLVGGYAVALAAVAGRIVSSSTQRR